MGMILMRKMAEKDYVDIYNVLRLVEMMMRGRR